MRILNIINFQFFGSVSLTTKESSARLATEAGDIKMCQNEGKGNLL